METIVGVEIFPLISFIIFFSFFVGLIIYVMRIKKSSIEEISALPLHDSEPIKTQGHENE
jgi:hypothetical protein